MRDPTSTTCVAIVPTQGKNYRKIAQKNWNLDDEQMVGMHVHHRIPASQGGTNDPSNLYVCSPWFHSNIWHGEDSFHPMIVWCSVNGSKGGKKRAEKGFKQSAEARAKMSKTRKGRKHSPEHSAAISSAKKGVVPRRPLDEKQWGRRISAALRGRTRPKVTCPHCGLTGGVNGMKRYHLDNCKHKQ